MDQYSSAARDLTVVPNPEQMPAFLIAVHPMTSGRIQHGSGDCAFSKGNPSPETLHFAKEGGMHLFITDNVNRGRGNSRPLGSQYY
jgi:hypothetical protein